MFTSSKTVLAVIFVLGTLLAAGCKSKADNNGEAVARVGSRNITMKQVDTAIKQQLDASGGAALSPADLVGIRLSALDKLVQEEALFQRAQKDNLVPDDNKVNQEIQRQKQEANVTEDEYQARLKAAGLSEEELRENVRRQLAINSLSDAQKSRVAQPTTAEIESYYGEHQAEFRAERGAALSIIVTDPAKNGTADDAIGDAQAEGKIKSVYDQLKSGSDFATIASQRSEEPNTALRNGELGFRTEEQLKQMFPTRPELVTRIMTMSAGQYTEPVQDNLSKMWYIIKVTNKVEQPRNLSLDDVRAQITNAITQQRQGLLLNALVLTAIADAGVKNYLAERIVQNPQVINEMKPSELLKQSQPAAQQPGQPQPRFENQNQGATGSARPSNANSAGVGGRPANANANR